MAAASTPVDVRVVVVMMVVFMAVMLLVMVMIMPAAVVGFLGTQRSQVKDAQQDEADAPG
jgi:hypothetical protein